MQILIAPEIPKWIENQCGAQQEMLGIKPDCFSPSINYLIGGLFYLIRKLMFYEEQCSMLRSEWVN